MLRVDRQSDAGASLGDRYGVDAVPSFLVFAPSGEVVERFEGATRAPVPELRRALREAGVRPR